MTHFENTAEDWWLEMVSHDHAELVPCYTREMADGPLKQCCIDNPGHDGPHDVPED